jgi:adenylate kinase family enzyme
MFIEKFTVFIKDITSKRTKKIKVDADDAWSAHKKALSYYNELTQDVIKIVDSEGTLAYNIDNGFVV